MRADRLIQETLGGILLHSTLHLYDHSGTDFNEDVLWEGKVKLEDQPGAFGLTPHQANDIVGGLSQPSKMPGYSYSLPAVRCKMGSILHKIKGSTCEKCYARKGNYLWSNVAKSMERRFNSIEHEQWPEAMATLIQFHARTDRKGKEYGHAHFRWHDSGDIQSVDHLKKIARVAELTPNVTHWLPTREYKMVEDYQRAGGTVPKNLTIRLSGHFVDKAPPRSHGLPVSSVTSLNKKEFLKQLRRQKAGKGVQPDVFPEGSLKDDIRKLPAHLCPAPAQGNSCGKCRACWDPGTGHIALHNHVVYHVH